jgi:hypothetical protein
MANPASSGVFFARRMSWNSAGWFGAQLGGSAWLLVAGILSLFQDVATGSIVLFLFGSFNLIGMGLWRVRTRLSAYAATQVLLGLLVPFSLAAIFVLDRGNLWDAIQSGGRISAQLTALIVIAAVAALMLSFYLRFGRRKSGG